MNKIFKKILTPAILMPSLVEPLILSSCAQEAQVIPMYDVTSYHPIEDKLASKEYNQQEIIQEYIKNVSNNPKIFESDMVYGIQQSYYKSLSRVLESYKYNLTSCKFGVTQPVFGTTTAWEDGFDDLEYTTISFKDRLSLVYECNPSETQKNIIEITLNVSYSDVIFYMSEKSNKTGWAINIYDNNIGKEALWAYERDNNPWSINLDCAIVEKRITTIPSGEQIVINESSYYSHVVNTTNKLEFIADACTADDRSQITPLEKLFARIILMKAIDSYFVRDTDNVFDVRLAEQLKYIINDDKLLRGLDLLTPSGNAEKWRIRNVDYEKAARIVWPNTEEDIISNEIGGTSRLNFNIKSDGDKRYINLNLNPSSDVDIKYALLIPFTVDGECNSLTPAYSINKNKFTIEVTYERNIDGNWQKQTDTIVTYIHYNTIIFQEKPE